MHKTTRVEKIEKKLTTLSRVDRTNEKQSEKTKPNKLQKNAKNLESIQSNALHLNFRLCYIIQWQRRKLDARTIVFIFVKSIQYVALINKQSNQLKNFCSRYIRSLDVIHFE